MAIQPEWLTSTVTALARCFCLSSSHSTRNFTREMMRLWERMRAQRSSRLPWLNGVVIATVNLSADRFRTGGGALSEGSPRQKPGQWYFFERVIFHIGLATGPPRP